MLAAAVAREQIGEDDTGGGGLPASEIVERNVLRALQPAFRVPRGFAMADVVDRRHALPRSLPGLTRQSIFFVRFFCEGMDARVKPGHIVQSFTSEISGASGR